MSNIWDCLRQRNSEPTSVEKFVIALFLMSFAYIILTFAGYFSMNTLISPIWLIFAYFVMTISELCLSPIGLSLVSKLAPLKFLSLTMGCWFLTSFFGNLIAGMWGGKYGNISSVSLFGALFILSIISGLVLHHLTPKLNHFIK